MHKRINCTSWTRPVLSFISLTNQWPVESTDEYCGAPVDSTGETNNTPLWLIFFGAIRIPNGHFLLATSSSGPPFTAQQYTILECHFRVAIDNDRLLQSKNAPTSLTNIELLDGTTDCLLRVGPTETIYSRIGSQYLLRFHKGIDRKSWLGLASDWPNERIDNVKQLNCVITTSV